MITIILYLWAGITVAGALYVLTDTDRGHPAFYLALICTWPLALPIWIVVSLERNVRDGVDE